MSTDMSHDPAVLDRLELLGLPRRQSLPITREIDKWVKCSGAESAVRRLKDIRNIFLHFVCGLPIDRSNWIGLHPDGSVKGPFRVLFKRGRDLQTLRATWNMLMIYSHMSSASLTKRQLAKWMKGVRREPPDGESLRWVEHYIDLGFESLGHRFRSIRPPDPIGDPILEFSSSPVRRAPTGVTLGSATAPEASTAIESVRSFAHGDAMRIAPHILGGTLTGVEQYYVKYMTTLLENGISHFSLPSVIGRIAILQEAGFKARCIANPGRAWQQAFGPLFRYLERLSNEIPGNWAMDQEAGRVAAREMMQKYSYACSIDLEGASDNIPLELQIYVLQKLGVDEEWIELVQFCSQGMWILPREVRETAASLKKRDVQKWPFLSGLSEENFVQWYQGQPLGLRFSFHLFSLTLGLIYEGVTYSLRDSDFRDPYKECKRVQVGDDLVLFDKLESDLIQDLLQSVGIPVSKDKTLESDRFLEFTSRLVSSSGIISAPKWKAFDDDNFFDFAKAYGPTTLWVYPWKWRRLIYLLENVPEKYGGLGWNPLGLSEWERSQAILSYKEDLPVLPSVKLEAAGARARALFYQSGLARLETGASLVNVSDFTADDLSAQWVVRTIWNASLSSIESLTRDLPTLLTLARDMLRKVKLKEDIRPLLRVLRTWIPDFGGTGDPSDYDYWEEIVSQMVTLLESNLLVEPRTGASKVISKRRQLERLVRLSGLG